MNFFAAPRVEVIASDCPRSGCGWLTFSAASNPHRYLLQSIDTTACQLCGVTAEAIIGKPLADLSAPGAADALAALFDNVLRTGVGRHLHLADDTTITATALRINESSVAVSLTTKTEDATISDAISRGKHQWERTVDAIDDIITIMTPDLRIIRANRAAHRLFGYQLGALVGRSCYDVFQGTAEPCLNCPITIAGEDRQPLRGQVYNRLLNRTFDLSTTRIYTNAGELQMIVHIARDVTDTLHQQEERNRLHTAIEQAGITVVITDTAGTIRYVNPAFSVVTGYTREEAVGKNMNLVSSGQHDTAFYRQLWNTILSGQVWKGRLINRKKDGTLFSEVSTISPVFDADGSISSFVAVKRDISREELLEKQLRQAVKLEAIGTLAGGIAHDFNNILSAILGYAQIAKGRLETDDPLHHPLDHIIGAGDRAADLINQILTFSRQERSNKPLRPLKAQLLVKEALKLLRSSIPTTIKMNLAIANDCPPILADGVQIHQLIMNLCTNARQAIESEHGEIGVELSVVAADPSAEPGPSKPTRFLRLRVSDSGCGMDEATQQRIFDPFFTTKPKDRGTGLGLAVVHGIVMQLNGTISVTSTPGSGSVFEVLLPTVDVPVTDVPEQSVAPLCGGSERIMVVDDEQQLVDYLKVMLERLGYHVTAFTDSLAAVEAFRANSDVFDLVLTDMTMPDMTGAELARELLAMRPDLPVILMTGYHEQINRDKALRAGIKEFFTKPLRKNELARSIREILDHGHHSHH